MVQQPQSTMVIPVLNELVSMNLPPCWSGLPCEGGGGWSITEKLFQAPINYSDSSKHLEIMKGN